MYLMFMKRMFQLGKLVAKEQWEYFNKQAQIWKLILSNSFYNLGDNHKIESNNHDDNNTGKIIKMHSDIEELHDIDHYKKVYAKNSIISNMMFK